MARKNRELAQNFASVSGNRNNINNDIEKRDENDINNDIEKRDEDDINKEIKNNSKLENLLTGKGDKKKKPQYIYLEPEVVKLLDKYGGVKKKGRSSKKSELINEILKEFFRKRGDL